MIEHWPKYTGFPVTADYPCLREDLVHETIKLLRKEAVIVIRAPPQVGKTVLLSLLGRKILVDHQDLEPVRIVWGNRSEEDIRSKPYYEILEEHLETASKENEKVRTKVLGKSSTISTKPRKAVFLIDEATNTYKEIMMWADLFKNPDRQDDFFVLVCSYGSAKGVYQYGPEDAESVQIPPGRRVELFPTDNKLQLLLSTCEIRQVVHEWHLKLEGIVLDPDVYDFLETETEGHAGMLSMLLKYLETGILQLPKYTRENPVWNAARLHTIIGRTGFLDYVKTFKMRGTWTTARDEAVETFDLPRFHKSESGSSNSVFRNITIDHIRQALKLAARSGDGYQVLWTQQPLTFQLCHQFGLLHSLAHDNKITYRFASRLHQRVAYSQLFTGPAPDTPPDSRSLLEICLMAMRNFNAAALTSRSQDPQRSWAIPEAAFGSEMYACMQKEIEGLPIFPEYAYDKSGRMDFYIPDKEWGLELLQQGNLAQIEEHAKRLLLGGKYHNWNITKDHITIHFCSKAKDLTESEMRNDTKLIQVEWDMKSTLTVRNANKVLKEIITLSGGTPISSLYDVSLP